MEERQAEIGRALWLEERRAGIGGSDAAAILGLSRWGTPLSVWLEKRGEIGPSKAYESMYWGTVVEPAIRERYMTETRRRVWKPGGILRHPDHPWMIGSPDGIVIGERRGVEIKMVDRFAAEEWGETFTDQIPAYYLVQCCHYMAITEFPVWDIAILIGGNDFRIYTVRRDLEFETEMIARLSAFWTGFVETGIRPEMDGSVVAGEWIARKFPREKTMVIDVADATAIVWATCLERARDEIAEAEERKARAENELKAIIGDRTGLIGEGWRVSWKATKDREIVDWKSVAVDLSGVMDRAGQSAIVAGIVRANTRGEPGNRRFLFTKKRQGGADGERA